MKLLSIANYLDSIIGDRSRICVNREELVDWRRITTNLVVEFAAEIEFAGGVPNSYLAYQEACNLIGRTE